MLKRRDLLKQTCAAALGMTVIPQLTRAAGIRSIVRRDQTLLKLGGVGDGFKMTWAADDLQYTVVNDGTGWVDKPKAYYNARLWTVGGGPKQAVFADVSGYPELNNAARADDAPQYFGHDVLAVRGQMFQFLSTLEPAGDRPRHWSGAKLIYSADNGRSWRNQDGSSPVIWENWNEQSPERLVFKEMHGCFSLLSILQMGRDYSANRDGYVYVYGLNGSDDGRMNELVMFRAPLTGLLSRRNYEFFGGRIDNGGARWVKDIEARAIVHTFPRGWVNSANLFPGDLVVESWLPGVVYNEGLGIYMMSSAGIGCAPDGTAFGKPSYLGFWIASTPWGPWRQVHEDTAWQPGNDPAARAYAPQIAPKWIAADGKSCWLVWADLRGLSSFRDYSEAMDAALEKADSPEARSAIIADFTRRYLPGYSFHTQRIDFT